MEHSQKTAINIKITLLNNKYISECGDIDLFKKPSNEQLLINQTHSELSYNADLEKQTLTRCNTNSRIPQASETIRSVLYTAQEQHAPLDCLEGIKVWVL